MIIVSVMYPAAADAKFDMKYYLEKHMPLAGARWGTMGMREAKVLQGAGAPGGGAAPYSVIALLTFDSAEAFGQAVSQHGAEIMGDVANFTNIQPIIQVNNVLL